MKKTKEIAEKYVDDSINCTIDNEIMFIRAQSLYEAIGDNTKAQIYQNKIEEFQKETFTDSQKYGSENYIPIYSSGSLVPVVKKQKIGRNAPCPCSSGKKYKKCCGKNI